VTFLQLFSVILQARVLHLADLLMATNSTTKQSKKPGYTRKNFSEPVMFALCLQVSRACPQCSKPLYKIRGSKDYKVFEIAHIYPLHPTAKEAALLKNETLLDADPNHPNNLIPLCYDCHKIFDTDKTIEKFRDLAGIKRKLITRDLQLTIFDQFNIENDIVSIVSSLVSVDDSYNFNDQFEAKEVDSKLIGDIRPITKRKIKNDVSSFYLFIRERFAELERETPMQAEVIASQVNSFYKKQKSLRLSQQEIFENTVNWISSKCRQSTPDAAQAVASFFVQNCELFE